MKTTELNAALTKIQAVRMQAHKAFVTGDLAKVKKIESRLHKLCQQVK
jgi:hypothetical protein